MGHIEYSVHVSRLKGNRVTLPGSCHDCIHQLETISPTKDVLTLLFLAFSTTMFLAVAIHNSGAGIGSLISQWIWLPREEEIGYPTGNAVCAVRANLFLCLSADFFLTFYAHFFLTLSTQNSLRARGPRGYLNVNL